MLYSQPVLEEEDFAVVARSGRFGGMNAARILNGCPQKYEAVLNEAYHWTGLWKHRYAKEDHGWEWKTGNKAKRVQVVKENLNRWASKHDLNMEDDKVCDVTGNQDPIGAGRDQCGTEN